MIGWPKASHRACLRLFALAAPAWILVGCNSDVMTPGSPDFTTEEYVQLARMAAHGDAEAIDVLLSAESVIDNDSLYKIWADRLAMMGDARGYYAGSMVRLQISSQLTSGDPEKLLLLIEALEFSRKAAKIDPEIYGQSDGSIRALESKIELEERELERRYGPVRKPDWYDERIRAEARLRAEIRSGS